MHTAARAGASGSACGSRRAPTGPARQRGPAARELKPALAEGCLPSGPMPCNPSQCLISSELPGSKDRRRGASAGRCSAHSPVAGANPPTPAFSAALPGKRSGLPPAAPAASAVRSGGGCRPRPAGPRQPLRPGRWDKGTQQRAGVGGNDPGAHARRALERCMTRALQHHQQPRSRSHRLPAPGRRAPAAELFLVRSRGRARRRWHRRLLSARAARRTPLLAVSCSRGAPRPWRARAARASRSVFSVRPRLRYAAAGSCSCLLTALPRSARTGVCPRPAPSATAARAPPPAPALG